MLSFRAWRTRLLLLLWLPAASLAWADSASLISVTQLHEDLETVVEAIRRIHPQPTHSVSERDLASAVEAVRRGLDHPMNVDEAWQHLAALNATLADGHLSITLPDWRGASRGHLAQGGGFFPYEVALDDAQRMFVVSRLGGAPSPWAGRQVLEIDGVPVASLVANALTRAHGDSPRWRAGLLSDRWWFFDWKLRGARKAYELKLDGAEPVREAASRELPRVLSADDSFERQYQFELLPNRGARLKVGSFYWPDKARFYAFTRDAFARMRDAGTRTLIIDVRANLGGDDDMWKEGLLPYIATRAYQWGSRYRRMVLKDAPEKGETAGQVVSGSVEGRVDPQPDQALHFSGDVYVLVGHATYSSAILFANVMQDYRFATLAGVGGMTRSRQSGGIQQLSLPNTGLVLTVPRFVLVRPSGVEAPVWVQPDIELREDPLNPAAAIQALMARAASEDDGEGVRTRGLAPPPAQSPR